MILTKLLSELSNDLLGPVVLASAAPDGPSRMQILWCSPTFLTMTGHSASDLEGARLGHLHGIGHEGCPPGLSDGVRTGLPFREILTMRRKSGPAMVVALDARPVAEEGGKIGHWILTYRPAEKDGVTSVAGLAEPELQSLALVAARMRDAAVFCDAQVKIQWVNDAFVGLTGYRLEEAVGKEPGQLLHGPETSRETVASIRQHMSAGEGKRFEILHYKKNGDTYWCESEISPIRGDDGKIAHFIGVIRDITERKTTALNLQQALAERDSFGSLLEETAQEIFVCDAQTLHFVKVNHGARQNLGYTHEELINMTPLDINPNLDVEGFAALSARLMSGETSSVTMSTTHRRKDGSTYPCDITVHQHYSGDRRWLIAFATDTSPQHAMLRQLAESEERYRLAVESANDGVWDWDIAADKVTLSHRNRELLNCTWEEFPDDYGSWADRIHPEDRAATEAAVSAHLEERAPFDRTYRMRAGDGSYRWWRSRGQAVWDQDGRPIRMVGTNSDITELKAAQERAEDASRLKSEFLANMSHEIRTPMNGIIAMTSALAERITDPELGKMTAIIEESGEALLSIINDILDISKIEAGRLTIEEVDFSIEEVARIVESIHILKAQEKGIGFSIALGDTAKPNRRGDPLRVQQILHNLISNAIKFTEKGHVRVSIDCAAADRVQITVVDSGIGMTEEQTAKLFQDFAQADITISRRFGGTGLGLSICRALSQAMGGDISVTSQEGIGTRFVVDLPLKAASGAVRRSQRAEKIALPPGLRILAADDNRVNRLVLETYLGDTGVDLTLVTGGQEAVDAYAARRFDVVLMDISMPGMDGLAALTHIRTVERTRALPAVPVIAVTANAMAHQVAEYLDAGFDAHLAKPIRKREILERISGIVSVARLSA